MNPVELIHGDGPIVLGLPHTGVNVPDNIMEKFNAIGGALSDTDWNVHKLYDGLLDNVTCVRATFHRYVIDANRDPSGESLYPGQAITDLCPLTDFDGAPIYKDGAAPNADEIRARRETYHLPYHMALRTALDKAKAKHGVAILYDCHSIRSHVPRLFEGKLPDFNIGTNEGATCAPEIESAIASICTEAVPYTHIVNGRFKGGWTTRHYGKPTTGIHAIQMELAQSTYMSETPPWNYDEEKAAHLRVYLQDILRKLDQLARSRALNNPR